MMRHYVAIATVLALCSVATAERRRVRSKARVVETVQVQTRAPIEAPPPPQPSVTLRQGVVAAQLSFEMSMSKGAVLAPASVAPDLSVGVTDDLTLAVVTSGSGLNGFRGSAGWGVCATGTDAGC